MDGTDEYGPENDPDHRGDPAPHDGDRGTEHGRQASDGGEVMPKENIALTGDVVATVFEGVCRRLPRSGELEEVLRDMLCVEVITKQIDTKAARGCHNWAHTEIIDAGASQRQIEMESSTCRT